MPDRPHLQASIPPPNTPLYATLLVPTPSRGRPSSLPRPLSLSHPSPSPSSARTPGPGTPTPSKSSTFNFTQLLLAGVSGSSSGSGPIPPLSSPRVKDAAGPMQAARGLMSTRQALSMGTTTVNFRRFVPRSGVVFWLQDRVEEVLMWKRGWQVTAAWMAGYTFLCFFPRLILLLPHVALLCVLLPSYLQHQSAEKDESSPPPGTLPLPVEGSTEWLANVQAIQNLMGFASDVYDLATPLIPHLTHRTSYSIPLTRFLLLTLLLTLPLLPYLPLRPLFLFLGLAPFLLTHPSVRALTSHPFVQQVQSLARLSLERGKNDDSLSAEQWAARSRGERAWGAVETWERESLRLPDGVTDTAGKQWLPEGARSAFEVALIPGWAWVESEEWVCDLLGTWAGGGADAEGWVYADELGRNLEDGQGVRVLRRRRWTRRIWRVPKGEKA
ncbi:hypothetical protein CALVIDRAFT_532247 [Calocera viscosa TUFC12733]|uniref:TECPR1-like DysF domain-containing protein n=1 Tax=Calocera viscosa (strain TUFC12733) TaxID=1330018 RepID=A0A167S1A4_CALVF|nr:hypothetical protein CALVIDRAFT_532247 [Calocera viscosa TUFC12733]